MRKKYFKGMVGVISSVLVCSTILTGIPSIAKAEEETHNVSNEYSRNVGNSVEVIQLEQAKIDEIKEILNQKIKEENSSLVFSADYSEENLMTTSTALQGTYVTTITVIGIGAVAIYTGGIIVAGVVFDFASSMYNSVKSFVEPYIVGAKIPNDLKKDGKTVDLGKFKDKFNNTPLTKNSGTFKNGKWSIDKDTAGHGGRKWKIKKNGDRVGSLDADGKILAD